ncbi:MAG: ADP-ribose pyrophosphatase [Parcubacteria group bacterium]|nr:ADP-ribose pyrophosphatase [Parcubacteria group bacterium]
MRVAARAVVLDADNKIALLHVTRDGYYKLPGGGVEEGEDMLTALKRECQEEIGCDIEVVEEIGTTTEYWKEDTEKQISHCFLTKLAGPKGAPDLTESEKERGYETVWFPYNEALEIVRNATTTHWEARYIIQREILFLEAAGNLFALS